ncbi:MAG: GNAT family N-acetyltransferase [Candidatus Promineifilaceae bacterium]
MAVMDGSTADVYYLEELAANAWTAEVVQLVDGWRFRYTPGVSSRRVNSVWPNNIGRYLTVEEKLALVEAFYARRRLPARFQISPAAQPTNLDDILAERGYGIDAPTFVQTVPIRSILQQLPANQETVTFQTTLPGDWFDFQVAQYQLNEAQIAARKAAFWRIGPQSVFALVKIDGETAGIGLGILERGWLGVFNMLTHPDMRRLGIATAVLHALAGWGQAHGANWAYLQVMEDNPQARSLYGRAGFVAKYQYYYRQRFINE